MWIGKVAVFDLDGLAVPKPDVEREYLRGLRRRPGWSSATGLAFCLSILVAQYQQLER
jgi:hypothetical protein